VMQGGRTLQPPNTVLQVRSPGSGGHARSAGYGCASPARPPPPFSHANSLHQLSVASTLLHTHCNTIHCITIFRQAPPCSCAAEPDCAPTQPMAPPHCGSGAGRQGRLSLGVGRKRQQASAYPSSRRCGDGSAAGCEGAASPCRGVVPPPPGCCTAPSAAAAPLPASSTPLAPAHAPAPRSLAFIRAVLAVSYTLQAMFRFGVILHKESCTGLTSVHQSPSKPDECNLWKRNNQEVADIGKGVCTP
jgi:hypothetical protein